MFLSLKWPVTLSVLFKFCRISLEIINNSKIKLPASNSPALRWNNKFKKKWTEDHVCIKSSRKGDTFAFCEVCRADFTISHGGYNDVKRHLNTEKHKANARAVANTSKVAFLHAKKVLGATNAEVLFQGMVMEHNLPLAVNDHFSKLVHRMFQDSEINNLQ